MTGVQTCALPISETLLAAIEAYGGKERRFGMISEQVQGLLPIQAFDPVDRIQS